MRPVCGCEHQMKLEQVGVVVVTTANGKPYQAWSGDLYECPECGSTCIARFGSGPFWERHHPEPCPKADFTVVS